MTEQLNIEKCRHCGGKAVIISNSDDLRRPYYVQCQSCKYKSQTYQHVEGAIADWNLKNRPKQAKVKYACGACGSEIHLGFATCPNCGADIDWRV